MANVVSILIQGQDQFSGPANKVKGEAAGLSSGLGSLGKTVAGVAGGFIAAQVSMATLSKGISATIGAAAAYEAQMAQIRALTGATKEDTDKLDASILKMTETLPKSPQELGAGAYFILSSGITDASEAAKVLEIAAKASTVGLGETEVVADALTTVLNAYGKEADEAGRVTDVLMQAVKDGKAEADAFSGVLGRVVPIAAQMGISFEEVAANLATFTRLGVSAEEAATGLRGVMNALLQPSEQARELLAGVHVSMDQIRESVREKGLAATLQDLLITFKGNQEAIATLFPEVRGLTNVLATAGVQADAYNQILGNMDTATGNLDKGFAEVSATAQFKMQKAMNDLNVQLMRLGTEALPAVAEGAEAMADAIEIVTVAVENFDEALKFMGSDLGEFATGLLPPGIRELVQFKNAIDETKESGFDLNNVLRLTPLGPFGDAAKIAGVDLTIFGGAADDAEQSLADLAGKTPDAIAGTAGVGMTMVEAGRKAKEDFSEGLKVGIDTLEEVQKAADETRDRLFDMFKEPTAEEEVAEASLAAYELQMAILQERTIPLTEAQKEWLDTLKLSGREAELVTLMTQGLTQAEAETFLQLRDDLIPTQERHLDVLRKTRDVAKEEADVKFGSMPTQSQWRANIDAQTVALLGLQDRVTMLTPKVREYVEALKSIPAGVSTNVFLGFTQETFGGLQQYQFGGRVEGPMGSPQLAVVHGGEEVLTPAQQREWSGPSMDYERLGSVLARALDGVQVVMDNRLVGVISSRLGYQTNLLGRGG